MPIADADIGPGSLALIIGSNPGFAESTVWFDPYAGPETDPSANSVFAFDPDNRWWKVHRDALAEDARLGGGNYLAGCPDLVENIDTEDKLGQPMLNLAFIQDSGTVDFFVMPYFPTSFHLICLIP